MSRKSRNRKRNRLPLLEQYRLFFNQSRNAGIEIIGTLDDGEGGKLPIVRYYDGREVQLPDVLGWVGLFDELTKLHPRRRPASPLSPTRPDST